RALAADNSQTYVPDVGMTLINLAAFYQVDKVDKELSLKYINEAITILLPFHEIGYIQNYLDTAYEVLKVWEIGLEAYMKEKLKELEKNNNQEEE
ncbi:MAG: hypothetical protein AAF617_15980, partial [Bacteroidota bacterium]